MIVKQTEYADARPVTLAAYDDLGDFATQLGRASGEFTTWDPEWRGGTRQDCLQRCVSGNEKYVARTDALVEKFSNVAIEAMGLDYAYGHEQGFLDVGAWTAGEPDCLYGPTMTKTERAPITVFVDSWISCVIPAVEVENRGVAVLALIRALSLHRPVNLYVVAGLRHEGDGKDTIQVIPAPTSPLDVSRCAFMLADPCMVRVGLFSMLYALAGARTHDGIPPLCRFSDKWQATQMGSWLAERTGTADGEYIHLPLMYHSESQWKTEASVQEWVTENVAKFVDGAHV